MSTYQVRTLDVLGHCGSECESDCPCMKNGEHDDNRCDCHYDINDVFNAGKVEIADDADHAVILATLDSEGFIHASMCDVDDYGAESMFDVVSKDTGRPLLRLERDES